VKFNNIRWCFVLKGGSVATLAWWSDKNLITKYMKSNEKHWVEI
jgi:hypothetical protein